MKRLALLFVAVQLAGCAAVPLIPTLIESFAGGAASKAGEWMIDHEIEEWSHFGEKPT